MVGVLCVEFFLTRGGQLLVNELAPRPHNSGHLTIDAHVTSQFEQQLRAVCGLPLGSTEQLRPAAMANLLGDVAGNDGEPDWAAAWSCALPGVKLHLYGKSEPRPGRKIGTFDWACGECVGSSANRGGSAGSAGAVGSASADAFSEILPRRPALNTQAPRNASAKGGPYWNQRDCSFHVGIYPAETLP